MRITLKDIILSNIIALISSFMSMIVLGIAISKLNERLRNVIKWFIYGIFFAIFLHAGLKIVGIYGLIPSMDIRKITAILLIIGSVFFMFAGFLVIKNTKRK